MSRYDKMIELEEQADHEERMRNIGQNGNDGLHYETNTSTNGFDVVFEEVKPTEELDPSYSCTDSRIVADAILKAESRKATPVFSGVLKYFPNAIKEVAKCSQVGNDQHHPEKPLHWDFHREL